ncbi:MAG TPA: M3 family metallopeptidase [Prolixibacteraceae bacterium]|nr:M3 family metallopeptidase [Prolixibacteraceae bacterium]
MKVKKLLIPLAVICLMTSCTKQEKKSTVMNPFFEAYNTPFEVPPFDKIQNRHYLPAFEEGIKQHDAEIKIITDSDKAPDFANTIEALDSSGSLLKRVSMVFFNLKEAVTTDSMQEIARTVSPLLSQHNDAVNLNEKLFARVKAVNDQKSSLNLNLEQSRLLEETYKSFVRGGANLPADKKEQLKKVNEELSLLELKFGDNMLAETNAFKLVIDKKKDLTGLPESAIAGAADDAKTEKMEGKWVFTLQKPSWIPFVTYAENRGLREKIYKAMYNRGNNGNANDNKAVISKIVNLRLQKANIMGFDSWSAFTLDDNMAKTPANVYKLLYQVWTPAIKRAKEEATDMQTMINKEGGKFKLASWDWWYYSEKVRKEKYDLDEEQIRPYFELNNVRDGVFAVANKLYGLTFTRLNNMPVFHPDCEVYEVKDGDGSEIGVLYMDFFPRASKKGGAWMTVYREQYITKDGKNIRPVVSITGNFSKPAGDKPALLSYEDVETLYHEFGHGLHGLLSQCNYEGLAGTNVARDFVELPSQVMEHWAAEPEVLKIYAKHYKTGEVIPQKLVDKIVKSGKFNQGFATVEYLAAAILDMDYHTITKGGDIDVEQFEKASMDKLGLIPEIIPRYKSTYFAHIFASSEYSSGYYSYLWAEVLDCDAFEAFKEAGSIFDQKVATSFRKNLLERGGTDEAMKLYLNFRGHEPGIEPLLKNRGLN